MYGQWTSFGKPARFTDLRISSSTTTGGYTQQQLTPEQQAAVDALRTDNKGDVGDPRTNIDYSNTELPAHLQGKFIGN